MSSGAHALGQVIQDSSAEQRKVRWGQPWIGEFSGWKPNTVSPVRFAGNED